MARLLHAALLHSPSACPASPGLPFVLPLLPCACSLHLDYGPVRLADLGGDAKSLVVALSNGTLQVFSWQGKVRRRRQGME